MGENVSVKVSVKNVFPGLVLANDIFTRDGLLLIQKFTELDEKLIFRMNLYQVTSVKILVPDNQDPAEFVRRQINVTNKFVNEMGENFKEFKDKYIREVKDVHEKLVDIMAGKAILISDLYEVTNVLMESVKTNSELLDYMHYLKDKNNHIYTHSLNVSALSNIFGKWLKLNENDIKKLTVAGLLHDLGLIRIDNKLVINETELSSKELGLLKKHVVYGYENIKDQNISSDIKNAVLLHHERIDGSGYMLGLEGNKIPKIARIIAIVDVYDTLTNDMTYKEEYNPFRVMNMFQHDYLGKLDTELLYIFIENMSTNYLNKEVLLTNGKQGKVVFINTHDPSRPLVETKDNKIIDLSKEKNLAIKSVY